jgi:hypothetical protein
MPYISFDEEPRSLLKFKVDVRFHFWAEASGLYGQCKRCGEMLAFGLHARPAEIEAAQCVHDCLGATESGRVDSARPPGDDQTVSVRAQPRLVFMGIPPR